MPASGGMWAARHEDRGGWVDEDTAGERRLMLRTRPNSFMGPARPSGSTASVGSCFAGALARYVAEMAVTGLTSTPSSVHIRLGPASKTRCRSGAIAGSGAGASTVARAVRAEQKQQLRAGLGGWRSDVCRSRHGT